MAIILPFLRGGHSYRARSHGTHANLTCSSFPPRAGEGPYFTRRRRRRSRRRQRGLMRPGHGAASKKAAVCPALLAQWRSLSSGQAKRSEGTEGREAGRVRLNLIALQFTSGTDRTRRCRVQVAAARHTRKQASTCTAASAAAHMFINVFHRHSRSSHARARAPTPAGVESESSDSFFSPSFYTLSFLAHSLALLTFSEGASC